MGTFNKKFEPIFQIIAIPQKDDKLYVGIRFEAASWFDHAYWNQASIEHFSLAMDSGVAVDVTNIDRDFEPYAFANEAHFDSDWSISYNFDGEELEVVVTFSGGETTPLTIKADKGTFTWECWFQGQFDDMDIDEDEIKAVKGLEDINDFLFSMIVEGQANAVNEFADIEKQLMMAVTELEYSCMNSSHIETIAQSYERVNKIKNYIRNTKIFRSSHTVTSLENYFTLMRDVDSAKSDAAKGAEHMRNFIINMTMLDDTILSVKTRITSKIRDKLKEYAAAVMNAVAGWIVSFEKVSRAVEKELQQTGRTVN